MRLVKIMGAFYWVPGTDQRKRTKFINKIS